MQEKDNELKIKDDKCPYNCVNGVIFLPRGHRRQQCPHCKDIRKEVVYSDGISGSKDVEELLGLNKRFTEKTKYDFNSIFRGSLDLMDSSSLSAVKQEIDELISGISLGELPKYSILLNLGARVFEDNILNPIMIRAYLAGLSVSKLLTVSDISYARRVSESLNFENDEDLGLWDELLGYDIVCVTIDEGITKAGVDSLSGFVYSRGRNKKPTILLTHSVSYDLLYRFATTESYFDYSVPKLVSIKYKSKDTIKSTSMEQGSKATNERVSTDVESNVSDLLDSVPSISFSDMLKGKNYL